MRWPHRTVNGDWRSCGNLSASPVAALLDVPPGASRIVLSPAGDAAALFYRDARRIVVLTGLPDSPSVAWRLDLPIWGPALPRWS